MKKNRVKKASLFLAMLLSFAFCLNACGDSHEAPTQAANVEEPIGTVEQTQAPLPSTEASLSTSELIVSFGDDGDPFVMHLYDNETAQAIANHVGTTDWRLPIYHYDDYENWEVMQYYDIPSYYEIPSTPQQVTSEAAGSVYYSEPNRIILYYGDAAVSAEYTPIGYFDVTDAFISAVENNPVLEGWGNKIVRISDGL